MSTATKTKVRSGYEKWQDGIDSAVGNVKWDVYDCEIQLAISEIDRHLSGVAGYRPLDWQLIKAMAWTETGANNDFWKYNPMQIGMYNSDPGLSALLYGNEGGDLILPPTWKARLNRSSVTTIPAHNIRAGIGYLLMKIANFAVKSVLDEDTKIYTATVKAGDSLDKLAKLHGSTVEVMKKLNPLAQVLHPGQVVNYQKASIKKVIVGWKPITASTIGSNYNGTGDSLYVKKFNYALNALRKVKVGSCSR